jgi:hypothetical protein
MKLKKEWALTLSSLALPLVSASTMSASEILNNEWFLFTVFFVTFFAVVYFSSFKTFDKNRGITAIISGAVALIVSISLTKRAILYNFLDEEIANIIFLIGGLIGAVYLVKFGAFKKTEKGREFSWPRFAVVLAVIIFIIALTDFYSILPEWIYFSFVGDLFTTIQEGIFSLAIWVLILGAILLLAKMVMALRKKNG